MKSQIAIILLLCIPIFTLSQTYFAPDTQKPDSIVTYNMQNELDSLKIEKEILYIDENNNEVQILLSIDNSNNKLLNNAKKEVKYNTEKELIYRADYIWDISRNNWKGVYKREITLGLNVNESTFDSYYLWNEKQDDWIGNYQIESKQNSFGKRTFYSYYLWDESLYGWYPTSKVITAYNETSEIEEEETYNINHETKNLEKLTKTNFFYLNDDLYLTKHYGWDAVQEEWSLHYYDTIYYENNHKFEERIGKIINGKWTLSLDSKTVTFLDNNKMTDSIIFYTFISDTICIQNRKTIHKHDENGKVLRTQQYSWNNNDWFLYEILNYEYDINGNQTYSEKLNYDSYVDSIIGVHKHYRSYYQRFDGQFDLLTNEEYYWNYLAGHWQGSEKDSSSLNEQNFMSLKINFSWDRNNRDWVYNNNYEYKYDEHNNLSTKITSKWDAYSDTWIYKNKIDYAYSEQDLLKKISNDLWNSELNNWERQHNTYYYYPSITNVYETKISEISIFPNPSQGIINLKGITNPCKVSIFSVDGKCFYTGNTKGEYLNISFLPKGVYLLHIEKDNKKLLSTKIVLR
ncbi:T9SS type A sorting domain-containing protein [uncultured Draconibacterium sp.]|uniref:T9SS type A sorting domain-containing protein n=1 Tax=uncultured Draconibacterium sp. TaxID=1573823 RepID=UPI002AA75945|nr:T9SS type A sorting domain-containing protein [uncultured Draconibacterium sp.]